MLALDSKTVKQPMRRQTRRTLKQRRQHSSFQTVALMFGITPRSEFAVSLIKPVFTGYIVSHKLVGAESRQLKTQIRITRRISYRGSSGKRIEAVVFTAIEIDLEAMSVVERAETRVAVGTAQTCKCSDSHPKSFHTPTTRRRP